ncbi:hypothetical protein [Rhizobium sp. RAF56]|uniref:hypothetical protein n=1 Tax=Rhizobium sp. RAF56 TaxID=3233062 RepID=UPI003F94D5BA
MTRAKRATIYAAVILGATLPISVSQAADMTPDAPAPTPVQTSSGWTYTVTPYLWAAGISGDVGVRRLPEAHINADFGDIWNNLDFGAMVTGEARYDRYSIVGDVIYLKLSNDTATPRGIVANNVEVTSKTFTGFLGAGYALLDAPNGHLDIVGGARLWSLDNTISFNGGFLDGARGDSTKTWVDAMAGLKGNYFFTPQIYTTGWGLVGGGGADVDWDVGAGLGYKFNNTFSAEVGYRAMGVNYRDNGFVYDVVLQGPTVGLSIHF